MFQIDEYVIHMTGGICQVREIAPLEIPGADKNRNYYFLAPLKENGSKVFVPVDNDAAIRRIYTSDEAEKLIDEIPTIEELTIDNEKLREARYREVIKSCDLRDLVGVLKNLYFRRCKRLEEGKKSTATDDKYIKIAEENLSSELAFVLGKGKDELKDIVSSRIARA